MKKDKRARADDLLPEYDFSSMKGGVRGKYAARLRNEAREKLEPWADDMVLSAEKALADTKEQIKALRRQARQATTLEQQHQLQEKMQKLERQQRRQRQEIFKVDDEIMAKRDQLSSSGGSPSARPPRRCSPSAGLWCDSGTGQRSAVAISRGISFHRPIRLTPRPTTRSGPQCASARFPAHAPRIPATFRG